MMISLGANVYLKNALGHGLLHLSVISGNISILAYLVIQHRIPLKDKDIDDRTLLHLAVINNNDPIVQLLLV